MTHSSSLDRPLVWAGLFCLACGWLYWLSQWVEPHCSMDAAYYHLIAQRVIEGSGFTEPFIWHFLKPYAEIIRPIDYWMPLGIALYAAAQAVSGTPGEIGLNIVLWGSLSVWIFRQILHRLKSPRAAWFGFFLFAIGGKYALYAVTSDNVVFYACFGALFFTLFSTPTTGLNSFLTGIVGGLMTLTRIEGIIFAAIGVLHKGFTNRKAFFAGLFGLFLVLSPWIWRNTQELKVYWPSFPRALYLHDYNQMFGADSPKTLQEYLAPGFSWALNHKLQALKANFREFFLVPTHLLFFPLWSVGLIYLWNREGRALFSFSIIFWFLNAFLFTTQSLRGTAFHTSAAMFPHTVIAIAFGFDALQKKYLNHWRKAPIRFLIGLFLAWTLALTLFGTWETAENYRNEWNPIRLFLREHPLPKSVIVGSSSPVELYYLNNNPGVVMPPGPLPEVFRAADFHGCGFLILAPRVYITSPDQKDLPEGWFLVSSTSKILAFEKREKKRRAGPHPQATGLQ